MTAYHRSVIACWTITELFVFALLIHVSGCAVLGPSPREILQEAGRICCDASTFEASGRIERQSEREGYTTSTIRWVFGPEGEYRFEHGQYTAIFDRRYTYSGMAGHREVGLLDFWSAEIEGYKPPIRRGPHNRYWGDLVMTSGMSGGGMTLPTAAMRELGREWTGYSFPEESTSLHFGHDEQVSGHPCRTVIARKPDEPQKLIVWVDMDLGVVRKWKDDGKSGYMLVQYDVLRVNPSLSDSEFAIPRDVIEKAPEGGGVVTLDSDEAVQRR